VTPDATAPPAATATPEPTATSTPPPQPDRVITAAVGEDFFVSLPLEQTTSFRWELDELPQGSLLTLIDEIAISPGGGTTQDTGWQHFVFRGKADGQATLSFWLVRPNGMPIEAVHHSIIIGTGLAACSEVFEVEVGETFEIVLQSNSSTGFRWQLYDEPSSEIVALVKEEYIAASTTAVGASGWQRFTFVGTGDGETDLDFWYVRLFDDPPAPANFANYKANVGTGIPGCSAVFTITIGEDLEIALGASPSSGYRWELSEAPTDGVVTLIKDEIVPGTSDGVGTPGVQTLTFRGNETGETALKLWYVRPFDDPAVPADSIAFMVIVS